MLMNRGEVWWVDFNPSIGGETRKVRPAIIVSNDASGFVKLVYRPGGKILGTTIVAARAGEIIQEWNLAIDRGLKLRHVAQSIHPYPTYSMANMQVAAKLTMERALEGKSGRLARGLARLAR